MHLVRKGALLDPSTCWQSDDRKAEAKILICLIQSSYVRAVGVGHTSFLLICLNSVGWCTERSGTLLYAETGKQFLPCNLFPSSATFCTLRITSLRELSLLVTSAPSLLSDLLYTTFDLSSLSSKYAVLFRCFSRHGKHRASLIRRSALATLT